MSYELPSPEITGYMGERELCWLYEQAMQMRSIIEMGCWKGRSTHALLSGCPGPVFAIDHFQGSPDEIFGPHKEARIRDISEEFRRNVGHFKNLVLMRMESVEAAKFFADKSVDMVFLDGCHTREAVLSDLRAWAPKCRVLMCGHDASYNTIIDTCNEFFGRPVKVVPESCIWSLNV